MYFVSADCFFICVILIRRQKVETRLGRMSEGNAKFSPDHFVNSADDCLIIAGSCLSNSVVVNVAYTDSFHADINDSFLKVARLTHLI